jgi:hypothetical protein
MNSSIGVAEGTALGRGHIPIAIRGR